MNTLDHSALETKYNFHFKRTHTKFEVFLETLNLYIRNHEKYLKNLSIDDKNFELRFFTLKEWRTSNNYKSFFRRIEKLMEHHPAVIKDYMLRYLASIEPKVSRKQEHFYAYISSYYKQPYVYAHLDIEENNN